MRIRILALSILFAAAACGSDDGNNSANGTTNAGNAENATTPDAGESDAGSTNATTPDAGEEADSGGTPDAGGEELTEQEPNNGSTATEFNDLPFGANLSGVIASEDVDIFSVPSTAGTLYTVALDLPGGSELQPHITVLDAGRDGDAPGQDYVKIARGNSIEFLAMGSGGHLIIVRDARNVDGGAVGGDGFTYSLRVDGADAADNTQGAVSFGAQLSDSLATSGTVHLWSFEGTEGQDVVFDMSAPNGDGRLWVYSTATGDWIARQDDRTLGDPNPLLDAPLTASGAMYLVVETISEDVDNVGYTIQTQ